MTVNVTKTLFWALELAHQFDSSLDLEEPVLKLTFDHRVNHSINEVSFALVPVNFPICPNPHSEKGVLPLLIYKG